MDCLKHFFFKVSSLANRSRHPQLGFLKHFSFELANLPLTLVGSVHLSYPSYKTIVQGPEYFPPLLGSSLRLQLL